MSDTLQPFLIGQLVRVRHDACRDGAPADLLDHTGQIWELPDPGAVCAPEDAPHVVCVGRGLYLLPRRWLESADPLVAPFAVATSNSVPLNDGSGHHTVEARLTP